MSSTQVTQPVKPSVADRFEVPSVPSTLTVEQAARRLGISRSTAYECVRNGSLPSLRFRRRIVIPAVIVERLLDGMNGVELEAANQSAG